MPDGLSVSALSGGYGAQTVLHDINLTIPEGTLTALIGPNGHGKSTLLRAISGLLPHCTGTLSILGTPVETMPPHKRALAGLVHIPQGDLLFMGMSVEANLLAGALRRSTTVIESALREVFDLFPALAERRKQPAASLSGGERRMVGIGRGLMQGGKILMIDEPSLGLAPTIIAQIYSTIRADQKQRTHDSTG